MNVYFKVAITIGIFFILMNCASAQTIKMIDQNANTSIRGMSVVNDDVAWISGSKGYIAITDDAGKNWKWQQVKGYEKADFRDIEAFSNKEAIIIASGTPALVLKTIDGGVNWKLVYQKDQPAYFLDAMDFENSKHGYIMGDPIADKFLLIETNDGGFTWNEVSNAPNALTGEAAFAASGTCLRVSNGSIYMVSGGTASRVISSSIKNMDWAYIPTSICQAKNSKGAFSLAYSKKGIIVVGGDYEVPENRDSVAGVLLPKRGFTLSTGMPGGFQSCVEYLTKDCFLSTGTSGTNISLDGGKIWRLIDQTSFNVCKKAKHGKLVLLAGDKGRIGILNF